MQVLILPQTLTFDTTYQPFLNYSSPIPIHEKAICLVRH